MATASRVCSMRADMAVSKAGGRAGRESAGNPPVLATDCANAVAVNPLHSANTANVPAFRSNLQTLAFAARCAGILANCVSSQFQFWSRILNYRSRRNEINVNTPRQIITRTTREPREEVSTISRGTRLKSTFGVVTHDTSSKII